MAEYSAIDPSTKEVFDDVILQADLTRFVKIKVIGDDKQKKIHDIKRVGELPKFLTGDDTEIVIVINEHIFFQLEDDQQRLVAEEAIAGIVFNSEKDKIEIKRPDVQAFSGVIQKFGYDKYDVVRESIKTLYEVKNNKGQESSKPVVENA